MATIYDISIGNRRTVEDGPHSGRVVWDLLDQLTFIDRENAIDDWSSKLTHGILGARDGEWTYNFSYKTLNILSKENKILARLKLSRWPARPGDEGSVTIESGVNHAKNCYFYVDNVE